MALNRLLGYRQSFRSLRSAKQTFRRIEAVPTIKKTHFDNMTHGARGEIARVRLMSDWWSETLLKPLAAVLSELMRQSRFFWRARHVKVRLTPETRAGRAALDVCRATLKQ